MSANIYFLKSDTASSFESLMMRAGVLSPLPPSFPTLHYPPVPLHVHNNNINITYCELRRLRVTTQVIMLSGKLARSLRIFTNEQVPFFPYKTITISLNVILIAIVYYFV